MIDDDDDRGDRHSDIANERVRKSEKNQTKIEKKNTQIHVFVGYLSGSQIFH